MVALAKSPPQTMVEMLLNVQKYMNTIDSLAVIRDKEKPREREGKGEDHRGSKRERGDRQGTDGSKWRDDKTPRMVKFTPLIIPIDNILKTNITLSGQGCCTHHRMCVTRRNTAVSTKTTIITLKFAKT